jgi:hypothetical protein
MVGILTTTTTSIRLRRRFRHKIWFSVRLREQHHVSHCEQHRGVHTDTARRPARPSCLPNRLPHSRRSFARPSRDGEPRGFARFAPTAAAAVRWTHAAAGRRRPRHQNALRSGWQTRTASSCRRGESWPTSQRPRKPSGERQRPARMRGKPAVRGGTVAGPPWHSCSAVLFAVAVAETRLSVSTAEMNRLTRYRIDTNTANRRST